MELSCKKQRISQQQLIPHSQRLLPINTHDSLIQHSQTNTPSCHQDSGLGHPPNSNCHKHPFPQRQNTFPYHRKDGNATCNPYFLLPLLRVSSLKSVGFEVR